VKFIARNLQIFKRIGLPLFVLTLIYTSLDQLLTINIDEALRNPNGANSLVWFYGFFSLVIGIVFPIMGILVVVYGAKNAETSEKGLWHFIQHNVNAMSIEILRSWGKTLLWSLLLVLPGIWKYVEYTMIPFVVALSGRYQRGEEDALQASATVVRHQVLKICAILLVFHVVIPSLLTVYFDDYRLVWHTPVQALILTLVDVYIFIVSTQLLLNIFEREVEKDPFEPKNPETPHAESHV
jgi:hypothetical protein